MLCRLPAAQSLSLKAPFLTALIYVFAAAVGWVWVPSVVLLSRLAQFSQD